MPIRNPMSRKANNYIKALSACTKTLNMVGCATVKSHVQFLQDQESKLVKAYGLKTTVKILKAQYLECQRFSLGQKIMPQLPFWVRRKKGFPCYLYNQFGTELSSSNRLDRLRILSLLRCYEAITLKPDSDISNVTKPSTGRESFLAMEDSWNKFLRNSPYGKNLKNEFSILLNKRRTQNKESGIMLHFSTKAGVSGKTCITAGYQATLIKEEILTTLTSLNNLFEREGWEGIIRSNQEFHLTNNDLADCDKSIQTLGKLSLLSAPGGKTRIVAIGNYWVQDTLLQLHRVLHNLLSKLETDGTYDQNDAFAWVLSTSAKGPVWSYDLSAATDRFPIEPQIALLKFLDPEIGELWSKLLNSLTFSFQGTEIKYSVGQPMGLYSSWATFSLTHHTVINYCAWKLNKRYPFRDYRILGDDVAIADKDVARMYKRILTSFDVEINISKSFIPESNRGPCVAEFAKRISNKGIEMTPIPPAMSVDAWRNFSMVPDLCYWLESRQYCLRQVPASRLLSISGFTPKYRRYLCCLLFIWGLLRGPLLDVTEVYPSLPEVVGDKFNLLKLRLERLEEKTRMYADISLEHAQGEYLNTVRGELEELLGSNVQPDHYFFIICKTRLKELQVLVEEFEELIDKYYDDESNDAIANKISRLEYLPNIDFQSIFDSLTAKDYKSDRTKVSEYLADIACQLDQADH